MTKEEMKKVCKKLTAMMLALMMSVSLFSAPVWAIEEETADDTIGSETIVEEEQTANDEYDGADIEGDEAGAEGNEADAGESEELSVPEASLETSAPAEEEIMLRSAAGETVTGTFAKISGKDVATIRYYTDASKTTYAFAEFNETASGYEYSFTAPYEGFNAVQGTSKSSANVVAQYYDLNKWDGAVDVSWYNETSSSFDICTPAQLAGLAAVVNGSINNTTPIYMVKGDRSERLAVKNSFDYDTPQTSKRQSINEGLPDCIENKYYERTNLIAGVEDEAYEGLIKHDFSNKTVNITADLDMGGVDGSQIDHSRNYLKDSSGKTFIHEENAYDGVYPNWTPIGGEYLMEPSDGSTMIKASFNGTLNGCGHDITNLYCFRWSYRSVGDTAYGYAQGTGLIGMMGSLYDGESQPEVMPAVRNMSLGGYIFGRRMVGGFVGCMGGGANAASGTSVEGGIVLENLANHAYLYCTDSKGLGGIVACSMADRGSIINCYNTGYLDADYQAPTGGIIGSNEGMSIYCCYNTGTLYTHGNKRGRGIGCNNSGKNYTVDDCYYLEGCGDDDQYPGYYTYNLAKSVSVNTVSMTESEMKNGTLLEKLNVNGTAYAAGDSGYPVLWWEKNSPTGSGVLTIDQGTEGGTVEASKTGSLSNGSVVYLSNAPDPGFKCRYYLLNGNRLSGNYATVNGDSIISAFFEELKAGTIKIVDDPVCELTVIRQYTDEEGITREEIIHNGDPVYEGNILMIDAAFAEGSMPENEDLIYKASAPEFFSNPYQYIWSYVNEDDEVVETESYELENYTVGGAISEDGITLRLNVKPYTAQKMWDYCADTSWYSDSETSFTLTNARQLAGLSVLVDEGKSFAGKTVMLGNDISLANDDGTSGRRFWDGIGSDQGSLGFAGTFDGAGHKITDYNGSRNGLFEYCEGVPEDSKAVSEDSKAVIKNIELWGSSEGQNACGIVMKAKNTLIKDCVSYCTIKGTTTNGHSAGILGYAYSNCEVSGCVNYAGVNGGGYVGGIAGEINTTSTITDCVNKGNVFSLNTGGNSVGGIIGSLNGQVRGCSNYGCVRAWGRNLGGIAGQSVSGKAVIDSCCNLGTVTYTRGTNLYDSAGGIIGYASFFNVKDSFNYGTVEKLSGTMPVSNMGAVFGRLNTNSKNNTEDVYYLDSSCDYAEGGIQQEELDPEAGYSKGVHSATAAQFARTDGVMASVNSSDSFILTNGKYPEVTSSAGLHVHSGGTATCSAAAVCTGCGLSYGPFSDRHGETKKVGAKDVIWLTDGYTGDDVCKDCGEVLTAGRVIKADPDREAVSIIVEGSDGSDLTKVYSIQEFDGLKKKTPAVGYSFGSKSPEIVAATQYVTLTDICDDLGIPYEDLINITVVCSGATKTVDADTLNSCNKYYEGDAVLDAPAAFMIAWNNGVGTLDTVAAESMITGTLRFGYGISQQQHDDNEAVGGLRLISPVETVAIRINGTVEKTSISNAEITVPDATYTGSELTPTAKVVLNGKTLKEGRDYTIAYSNNIDAGTAEAIITGKGIYEDSVRKPFVINAINVSVLSISVANATYNGKVKAPEPAVKFGEKTLVKNKDYSVTYAGSRKNVGLYSVTVKCKGNYSGSRKLQFRINPKGTSLSSVKGEKKYLTVKWKKQTGKMAAARITGYQIQVSTNSGFKSGNKTVTVKGYKKASRKVSGLKAKKKYYVRIRTYMKTGGKTFYSSWSKARSAKTK